jgi:DNA-binding winged helix-turn-helix (wHTH) protein/Tol biopolymer transport system component
MAARARRAYLFGDFELSVTARVLTRNSKPVQLGSKSFEVLTCLVLRAGEVVSKDELLKAVWPDAFVEEGNLTQQISALRKALGDCSGYIATIAGKGYQFTAEVRAEPSAQLDERPAKETAASRADRSNLFVVESRPRTAAQLAPQEDDDEDAVPSESKTDRNTEELDQVYESAPPPSIGAEEQHRGRTGGVLRWAAATAMVALLVITAYFLVARQRQIPFEHFTIQKATDSGNVPFTAISPDGAYLASVLEDEEGNESLWIHHIATGSERPILQDAAFRYRDVTFSPDGSFIYFRTSAFEHNAPSPHRTDLYRIPILGGQAARIAEGVDARASFIDNGRRLCFYRENTPATYAFISTAADGGDERELLTGKAPYPIEAACAPDGRRGVVEDDAGKVEIRNFRSGSALTLISLGHYDGWLRSLVWEPNGRGIFAIHYKTTELTLQLSFLSYPDGVLRGITSDLSEYTYLSVTANADTIVATQQERSSTFDEISLADPAGMQVHPLDSLHWFIWLDGHTILTSDLNGVFKRVDLTDGKGITLNVAKERALIEPVSCGPSMIVASGHEPGAQGRVIYKMSLDGSAAMPVTRGPNDILPECTPDGKLLFYNDNRDDKSPVVVRASLNGGTAQKVTSGQWSSVSPDGKMIAVVDEKSGSLGVFSTDSLQRLRSPPLPSNVGPRIAFSADSKSIFYVNQAKNKAVIWRQPLDGAAAIKIADIPRVLVYWIRPSPDGSKLGLTAITTKRNAVVLHDVR